MSYSSCIADGEREALEAGGAKVSKAPSKTVDLMGARTSADEADSAYGAEGFHPVGAVLAWRR